MHTRMTWLAGMLVLTGLAVGRAAAQGPVGMGGVSNPGTLGYAPPSTNLPLPIYSTRPDSGIFFNGGYIMYEQTMPLRNQVVAVRGFRDLTGALTGVPNTFVGSNEIALDTNSVRGPGTFQPGFEAGIGYRFENGAVLHLNWWHLNKAEFASTVSLLPPNFNVGGQLQNTFLFSPVFNFPSQFSGPTGGTDPQGNTVPQDIAGDDTGATFGIWNAADIMTLSFTQRNEQVELTYRTPIFETENWRMYGLIGPRFVWFWEGFKWRTTDLDSTGSADDSFVATYTNITSNRMYGVKIGVGNECYLGHGFAASLDLQVAGFLNVVKERAKYEVGPRNLGAERKRARVDYTVVPEFRGTLNMHWYPYEGIQFRVGYDIQTFLNTIGMRYPITFDYGGLDPSYERVTRVLNGLQIGLAIIF